MKTRHKGLTLGLLVTSIVVISVFLTQLVTITVGYKNQEQVMFDNTLEMNRINAEKLAITTDNVFRSLKHSLSITAEHLSSMDEISQMQIDLIRGSNNNFNSIFVANHRGEVRVSSPSNVGIEGQKLTSIGAQQALQERRPLISEPYIGLTERLIILISHPIFDPEGRYIGFVGGTVYLHEDNVLGTMLGKLPLNEAGSYIYVVSAEGNILYHPQEQRIGDKVISNEVVAKVMQRQSGQQRIINSQHVDLLAGYHASQETGWGVVSQTPTQSIIHASQAVIKKIIIYSIPLMLAIVVLIFIVITYISRPLNKLAVFAEQLYDSDDETNELPVIHRWNYEANQLYRTFSIALTNIQNRVNELSNEAQTDALTGLSNRRSMEMILTRYRANQISYCYIIMDIDHFKLVNDRFGHDVGDKVLQFLARVLLETVQQDDRCCRYGGEEFVVISPNCELQAGLELAERIRRKVEQSISPTGKPITLSLGVAASADSGYDHERTRQMADQALYRAKNNGRNRVEGSS